MLGRRPDTARPPLLLEGLHCATRTKGYLPARRKGRGIGFQWGF